MKPLVTGIYKAFSAARRSASLTAGRRTEQLPLINNKEALKSDPTLVETARRQTVQGKSPLPQEHGEQRERRKLVAHLIKKSTRPFRRAWTRLKRKLVRLGARSRLAATLYYALFDRSFDREHQATLAGRVAFETARRGSASTSSLLRRNIHRLENGLLMRPRRNTFALDYIDETLSFYAKETRKLPEERVSTRDELQWAHDVLQKYFAVTSDHPRLRPLRKEFAGLESMSTADGPSYVPYKRDLRKAPPVAYEDLLHLAQRSRSVRWFLPEPVPRELIENAIEVALLSPSACNRQPFLFRVFDDPELLPKIASLPGGTVGFHHQFPAMVVLVGEMRNYYGERDRHLIYIDASLAAMSFVFAAETLGLSTCCINWPDIEEYEREAEETLLLEKDQRIIMFLAVGYPDPEGKVAYSQKKPKSEASKYNL
jgi:nitroreductase